jgi:hypothetical protein
MTMKFKTTIELDVEVVGKFDPGIQARLSGPPEDCYEGEPEHFEIEAVLVSVEGRVLDVLPWLDDKEVESLSLIGCEEARERAEDERAEYEIASAEARRDAKEDR